MCDSCSRAMLRSMNGGELCVTATTISGDAYTRALLRYGMSRIDNEREQKPPDEIVRGLLCRTATAEKPRKIYTCRSKVTYKCILYYF